MFKWLAQTWEVQNLSEYSQSQSDSQSDFNKALDLLNANGFNVTSKVEYRPKTGAYYWQDVIGIGPETDTSDIAYLAAEIVHEERHNQIYKEKGYHKNSQQEELDCISKQADCLEKLEGNSWRVQKLRQADGLHYLQD